MQQSILGDQHLLAQDLADIWSPQLCVCEDVLSSCLLSSSFRLTAVDKGPMGVGRVA